MRSTGLPALIAWLALQPMAAHAVELVAIRPGMMCQSADALGRLTLPNGESRTHAVAPHAEDLATATAGHCTDLDLGQAMTMVTVRHNTSIVAGEAGGPPLVVPNIDVQPVAAGTQPAGNGMVLTQHLPTGDGQALEILEDARITPDLRHRMWDAFDVPGDALDGKDPRVPTFEAQPLLTARLRLVTAAGAVLAERTLERPLAMLAPAPLDGLPSPAFLLTVDYSSGMGSYSGPATTLLVPHQDGLDPEQAVTPGGTSAVIELPSTLKTFWRIVPPRVGHTQEIELASCRPLGDKPDFVTTYATYRFGGGHWRVSTHAVDGLTEFEGPPERSLFP